MRSWSRAIRAAATATIAAAAVVLGTFVFDGVQFARADQQVESARQHLAQADDAPSVFKDIAHAVGPSVVQINVTKTIKQQGPDLSDNPMMQQFLRQFGNGQFELPPELNGPQTFKQSGTGSGVIMEASGGSGFILTNNHVAGDAGEMTVILADGRKIKNARLVGADPKTDLAVVEIKADHLIAAKWGESTALEQGDTIVAFGSPFGYVGSMTHGIVSAMHRQQIEDARDPYKYEDFIQVDAPINPGNSGGPLVNVKGEVVGINTAIASSSGGFQGIGFAIPSDQAKPVYQQLKGSGKIVRGWIGLEIVNVSDVKEPAESTGYNGSDGVLIRGVLNDSPASGKLHPGDVVTSLDGKKIKENTAFRNAIASDTPGTEVSLGIVRDGKDETVKVKLGEQPGSAEALASANRNGENATPTSAGLGLRLANLNGDMAQRFGLDSNQNGAAVIAVKPGSPAQQAGIEVGDVITRIGNQDVTDAKQAQQALSKADLKKGIRLEVANKQGSEMIFLQNTDG